MRWADTDSEDSDDEFQTHPSRSGNVVNTAMIDLSVSRTKRILLFWTHSSICFFMECISHTHHTQRPILSLSLIPSLCTPTLPQTNSLKTLNTARSNTPQHRRRRRPIHRLILHHLLLRIRTLHQILLHHGIPTCRETRRNPLSQGRGGKTHQGRGTQIAYHDEEGEEGYGEEGFG